MLFNPNIQTSHNSMLVSSRYLDWKIMIKHARSAKQISKMAAGRFMRKAQFPYGEAKHLAPRPSPKPKVRVRSFAEQANVWPFPAQFPNGRQACRRGVI